VKRWPNQPLDWKPRAGLRQAEASTRGWPRFTRHRSPCRPGLIARSQQHRVSAYRKRMSATPDPAARTSAGCADRIGLLNPRNVIEVATGADPQPLDHPGTHHLLADPPASPALCGPLDPGTDLAAHPHHRVRAYPADHSPGQRQRATATWGPRAALHPTAPRETPMPPAAPQHLPVACHKRAGDGKSNPRHERENLSTVPVCARLPAQ
jgi:hypothetical protein